MYKDISNEPIYLKETANNSNSENCCNCLSKRNSNNEETYYNEKSELFKSFNLCGIRNYGSNCYLNSGLQILSRCDKFINWLNDTEYPEEYCPIYNSVKYSCNEILNSFYFIPKELIQILHQYNNEFNPKLPNCSQSFIRTVINNINKEIINYNKVVKHSKGAKKRDIINNLSKYIPACEKEKNSFENFICEIFPQSIPYYLFSGIIKIKSTGNCDKCGIIKKNSFMEFFDFHIYLDTTNKETEFKKVLKENLGYEIEVKSKCPNCLNNITLNDNSKLIKYPEILIFTLERFMNKRNNKVPIIPNEYIDIKEFVDDCIETDDDTVYELFAINIRFGASNDFGHQICQIKKDSKWFTLNDDHKPEINSLDKYNENSYGLFYKKKKIEIKIEE